MRKIGFVFLFVFAIYYLPGCAGSCIKVNGSYGDVSGGVEYCFDKKQSEELKVPVVTEGDEKFFGFNLDEVKKMLENIPGISEVKESQQHPVTKLKQLLQNQAKKIIPYL